MEEQGRSTRAVGMRAVALKLGVSLVVGLSAISMLLSGPAAANTYSKDWDQRNHIRSRARSAVGSSYRYGGASRRGFDCSGLTMWTWGGHGANLPHSSQRQFDLGKRDSHKRIWKRNRLKVGDLVFHKTTSARVGHAGIYIGNGKFISATSSSGVRVRNLYDGYWGPRWVGATRLPVVIRG
jgi:hypothetical protein